MMDQLRWETLILYLFFHLILLHTVSNSFYRI